MVKVVVTGFAAQISYRDALTQLNNIHRVQFTRLNYHENISTFDLYCKSDADGQAFANAVNNSGQGLLARIELSNNDGGNNQRNNNDYQQQQPPQQQQQQQFPQLQPQFQQQSFPQQQQQQQQQQPQQFQQQQHQSQQQPQQPNVMQQPQHELPDPTVRMVLQAAILRSKAVATGPHVQILNLSALHQLGQFSWNDSLQTRSLFQQLSQLSSPFWSHLDLSNNNISMKSWLVELFKTCPSVQHVNLCGNSFPIGADIASSLGIVLSPIRDTLLSLELDNDCIQALRVQDLAPFIQLNTLNGKPIFQLLAVPSRPQYLPSFPVADQYKAVLPLIQQYLRCFDGDRLTCSQFFGQNGTFRLSLHDGALIAAQNCWSRFINCLGWAPGGKTHNAYVEPQHSADPIVGQPAVANFFHLLPRTVHLPDSLRCQYTSIAPFNLVQVTGILQDPFGHRRFSRHLLFSSETSLVYDNLYISAESVIND